MEADCSLEFPVVCLEQIHLPKSNDYNVKCKKNNKNVNVFLAQTSQMGQT